MNIGKALRAALSLAYWRGLARGVVPTIEHSPAFVGIEPRTVMDVGANKGQFSSFAAVRWPNARLIAFEPLPGPAARFQAVLGDRATLHRCALGARADRMTMRLASRADSSSLLELGDAQKALFNMDEVSTLEVDVRRLDEVLDDVVEMPALLKIDVQGFEYEVLEGLGSLADSIEWIFVEASFIELYRGQRLYEDVARLLKESGYDQMGEYNVTMDGDSRVQADLLFRKRV